MSDAFGFSLSRQQSRLFSDSRTRAVVQLVTRLDTSVAPAVLRGRLEAAMRQHEVLRSTLRHPVGLRVPVQQVHDDVDVAWPGPSDVATLLDTQPALLDSDEGPVLAAAFADGDQRSPGGDLGPTLVMTALAMFADLPTLQALAAEVTGAPAVEEPIQYAEYAAWQQEQLTDPGSEQAIEARVAWQQVAGESLPTVLDPTLPARGNEHDPASDGPAVIPVLATVPNSDASEPRDWWLAAWILTIARLSGEPEVSIGLELDPREDPQLVGAAGPYTLLTPMSVPVAVSGPSHEFVTRVQQIRKRALSWFEWAPDEPVGALLFSVSPLGSRSNRPPYQLELKVSPDGTAAEIVVGPSGSPELGARVAQGLCAVLTSLDGPIEDVDVLTVTEVAHLLGDAPVALATTPVVLDIISQASNRPNQVALVDETGRLTYRELADRVQGLAAALVAAGGGSHAPVALLIERSADLIVAMLAAQRAGAGYLPLDVDQPTERLLRQVELSGATLLVTGGRSLVGFRGTEVSVRSSGTSALPALHPESLSYVIFTSGSTGVPKGVAVTQRALANYVAGILAVVGPSAEPRSWALVTTPTTDLGNTVIFPALASGGTLHVLASQTSQDPTAFADVVGGGAIDIVKITPSHLAALLADPNAAVLPREVLFVGGEALGWGIVEQVSARGTCRIVNHYGPTETTVGVLVNEIAAADTHEATTVPIGRPLPGCEALVIDGRRRLVPDGALGELAVGGHCLARGYVADEEQTRQRFVEHPYRPGERIYLTGDVVLRRADGSVVFVGRRDGQVKIRGFRVERGEVEAALLTHPAIRRATVTVRPDPLGEPQLVGYVVSQVNPRPTEEQLRGFLGDLLPDYMVPARIVELDDLPLRSNGKLDEAALPAPTAAARPTRSAPEGPAETAIAAIFEEVLGVDAVGATDDFFELGGHSLLATRVIVEIRSRLEVQLPFYVLFEASTVRALAAEATKAMPADVTDYELAQIIADLSDMSDEEAAAFLAIESAADGKESTA
jgi:amino acid adenylation domain-containing protein